MKKQSERYRRALYDEYVIKSTISGCITLADGITYPISDSDILPGTLNINNKCVNGSSFEFGAVYQGELQVQLIKNIDRYQLKGARIEFTEHRYLLPEEDVEDVYLGAFYISEPERSGSLLNIKALDRMDNFDKEIQDNITGTAYQLITAACEICGVEFVQTENEVLQHCNADQLLSVGMDTVDSYRDMLAYIGLITGSFFVIADDKLAMRVYATENSQEISIRKRNSTVISDYETFYDGVRARFIANENYAPYNYVANDAVDGLIMDLGDIPIVRGLPETKNKILQTLYDGVLKQIRYTPASFSLVNSDAALELGDMIRLDAHTLTYITGYTYVYHGSMSIKGVGDNPRLKSKDKTYKMLQSMEASLQAKNITVHTYTNIQALTIRDTKDVDVITINFAAAEATKPVFIATLPLTMTADGYVVLTYWMDGAQLQDDTLRAYLARGEHFLTISNNFQMKVNTRRTLLVKMHTEYYESDTRQQAAKILSFEQYIATGKYTPQDIDTTPPVASIAAGSIRAALYAQGLAGTEVWDGTINIAEYITPMELPLLPIAGFTATSSLRDTTGPGKGITESFVAIDLPMLPIAGFMASPVPNQIVTNYTLDTEKCGNYIYNEAYVDADGAYRIKTVYEFAATKQDIEEGQLYTITIETSQFAAVRSVELEADAVETGSRKYLICAENVYYNVTDGGLTETAITEPTVEDFATYGSNEVPDGSLLLDLTDPQVLCWTDGEEPPTMTVHVTATPMPQTIISGAIDLTHETIKGIENITASCEGPLILAVSFDDQETWRAWNGAEWITLSSGSSGMSKETLEAVTADQWQQLYQGADNLFIRIALVNGEQSVSEVRINFVNQEVE